MNTKIFDLVNKKLQFSFNLPKYDNISINKDTAITELPWTSARYDKFTESINNTLGVTTNYNNSLENVVNDLDNKYMNWFFGEVWKPKTDEYIYTGWTLVDTINKQNPDAVLDVGCGYNQFKGRIQNLVGLDPYNSHSDYQVDILEYAKACEPQTYDAIIALGSINFNSEQDISDRIGACVKLLKPKGKIYFRVNPGIQHEKGPWVDVFPWSFEFAVKFAKQYQLNIDTYKKDSNNRIYFVYHSK